MNRAPGDDLSLAVVGGGVAGITAAHALSKSCRVTLFERDSRLGGHTHTATIPDGPDAGLPVDTGFIVFNDRTYPHFRKFLSELDMDGSSTDMSFSAVDPITGDGFAGTGISGLFGVRSNIVRPRFWKFLHVVAAFCRRAGRDLERGGPDDVTLGKYLLEHERKLILDAYLAPMASAIWSSPHDDVTAMSARFFLRFFANHGLLGLRDRPRWMHIHGGSETYVHRFLRHFSGTLRTGCPVARVRRTPDGVFIQAGNAPEERFDAVFLAAHADQTLSMLSDPDPEERRLLSPWSCSRNRTILHTDEAFMPANRRLWACWNVLRPMETRRSCPVQVTYHMNRLQKLDAARNYFVTLNPEPDVPPEKLVAEMVYEHPVFTREALASQDGLRKRNGTNRTFFCGSYMGYGFHEDAVCSSMDAVQSLETMHAL